MTTAQGDLPAIQRAALQLYQLYDVSFTIDLELARTTLAAPTARVRPVVSRGASIDIPQLPLEMSMGTVSITVKGRVVQAALHARVYDLGILAFRLIIPLIDPLTWDEAADVLGSVQGQGQGHQGYPEDVHASFTHGLDVLRKTLEPAIDRPNTTILTEDYTILLIEQLAPGMPASQLARHPALLRTALGERRPLSASASSLATTLSYYEDDLILLTWATALVIEPDPAARDDAALLLEFANVQLLAFRTYDGEVDRDLARIAPRIAARHRPRAPWQSLRASGSFQHEIHSLIADITDSSARVENALKVTEDVYWNRVYAAALAVLRVDVWRTGLAEALGVLRQTTELLHAEAQERLATLLEILVIVLIAVELVVAILAPH